MSTEPEMSCAVCNKAVDLTKDINTDENGQPVHVECYLERLKGKSGNTSRLPG
jgi:hypothetical protein